ncbi:hypothetical protein NV379_01915 [Paenibacillus sp. N1-5-1-14]|uniref:hypothetical protein n=1 Tax=Paenibacillus radicibacter TaxID=2972488 RepID=UPI002159ADD2|nr:hypothetical protein [Paenibacillus radicibacter]MCR8641401.1 hypothetical protein [Paenibacillus radicibacter]
MKNEDGIRVRWSKLEKDWIIHYPNSHDGFLTSDFVGGRDSFKEWIKELSEREYDLSTLKISVRLRTDGVNGS